jgi:single-stranded-DNA-specific exonuclease
MLCGAGVAFYLVMALKREMERRELLSHNVDLKSLLDFFVIGTLTDMVPLIEENRVLSKHGLSVFSRTQRPGLKALVQRLNMSDREITGSDLAIRIAPKLNALSRMESGVRPIEILLEKNPENAASLVESALKVNDERLTHQQSSFELAVQKVQALGPVKDFIFIESKEFHRGIVGLIATKLAQEFNVPTFVGATNAEGVVVGSARMPKDSFGSLLDILGSAKGLLSRFGGHAAAAGFEYQIAHFEGIYSSFVHYFRERPSTPEPSSP